MSLAAEGYGWLPNRRRRTERPVLRTRLMGQRAVAIWGPEAARFFYDESHVRRQDAIPEMVRGTLFGKDAVHTLDGAAHRHRKALFLDVLGRQGVADLVARVGEGWDEAAAGWAGRNIVLFDEASRVIARAVTGWAGIPVPRPELAGWAADLVAMVDGFATLGPRHWRARRARGRREHQLADLVIRVRRGELAVPPGAALDAVAHHREQGAPLEPRVAAVELLNVVRPTVAAAWFVAFSAHALHRWPELRHRLSGGAGYATAFAHEVRRFYPFAPFVGGRAVADLSWRGESIPAGALVLLDIYGQHHDPALWPEPYAFQPERFLDRHIGEFDLIPQGGGDPATGHRCPGEPLTVSLLAALAPRLAALEYAVPDQDLTIPLERIPTRPVSGVVLSVAAKAGAAAARR